MPFAVYAFSRVLVRCSRGRKRDLGCGVEGGTKENEWVEQGMVGEERVITGKE